MREKHIHLRLTASEYRQLTFLADHEKRKPCSVLRFLISAVAKQNGYAETAGAEPQSSHAERQRYRITLSFSKAEWQMLDAYREAHSFGSVSAVMLSIVRQTLTGASLMPAVEVHEIQKCRSELNRIGINLNQIARRMNAENDGTRTEEVREIRADLAKVRKFIPLIHEFLMKACSRHDLK